MSAAARPLVSIDTDPDTLGAARLIIDALRSEIDSLRTDLRESREQVSRFEEVSAQPHIETDWEKKTYTVERIFVLRVGPFKDFPEAVRVRAEIMAKTQILPLADKAPKRGE